MSIAYFTIVTALFIVNRVASVMVITAKNLTYALQGSPDSSKAYESGNKILSLIKDSEAASLHTTHQSIKLVMSEYTLRKGTVI